MSEHTKEQALINSIIGGGTRFRGDLDLHGLLRIDGDFEGNINTNGRVLVGRSGRARCLINADTVVIGGIVQGDVNASTRVVLLSTCIMMGNIRASQLIVEDGVIFHGQCTVSEDAGVIAASSHSSEPQFSVDWGSASSGNAAPVSGL